VDHKNNQKNSQSNRPPSESLQVTAEEEGIRLDRFCATRIPSLSRNQVQKLNESGRITVDGRNRSDHYALSSGEAVVVILPEIREDELPVAQDIPITIVYEDEHIVVINKTADFVVHPAHGNRDGTVVNALLGRGVQLSQLGGPERPGIVHRLDKDTSGLMVVAKTDDAYRKLSQDIKDRLMSKTYHAIAWGNLGLREQTIDAAVARHPVFRQKMAVARRGGREALTEVFVVDSFEHFDYIRVVTLTGRTHQIRVHLAHISHPILGDDLYGGRRSKVLPSQTRLRNYISALQKAMPRQALHASRLSFEHPITGVRMNLKAGLPEDMRTVLEKLHIGIKEAAN
jgi:23S rRNA pseudouridine1911/1915/1917 synthase